MANRLAHAASPYLLQHAHQPVDWHPWDAEALALARRLDRPILLSIGYAACHWCHVMAHECFEDEAIARRMNAHFVNIKVDREERPDLDRIYQQAHAALTGRGGGWPLTVFLDPETLDAFFAGTYFPPEPRHGLPAFPWVLERLATVFREQRQAVREQGAALRRHLRWQQAPAPLQGDPLQAACDRALARLDRHHGGFGAAPKFPQPTLLGLLLTVPGEARAGALLTLRRMAEGGLQDHVGGGFYRYSVDDRWEIPHFEKMLYDNALLLPLYARAACLTGEAVFRQAAEGIGRWLLTEMQSPEGGFYASLDADSAGGEGRFYLWTPAEVAAALGSEAALWQARFGLDGAANFEGRWHLRVSADLETLAARFETSQAALAARLEAARARLAAWRAQRPAPARDDKILSAWNGLAIAGLAEAGRLLARPAWIAAARHAAEDLRARAWRGDHLAAVVKGAYRSEAGFLDDYACLAYGLLWLFRVQGQEADLAWAQALVTAMARRFGDVQGGYWFTDAEGEPLPVRPKSWHDEALPAGNGVAAWVHGELAHLGVAGTHRRQAARILAAAGAALNAQPEAHASLALAWARQTRPGWQVVVAGPRALEPDWGRVLAEHPLTSAWQVPQAASAPALAAYASAGTRAWVCTTGRCLGVAETPAALAQLLREARDAAPAEAD